MPARHTFSGSSQSVVKHSILICIVVILQNTRVCHTSHAVGMCVIWRQCQLWIHFCDGCVHTHSKYVLWHITICMHKAWGRKQCVSHGNTRSATQSSKCGSEILHIHLEESHTSHCRARAILQTLCRHASFFSRDACVFAMLSHLIVVVTTD